MAARELTVLTCTDAGNHVACFVVATCLSGHEKHTIAPPPDRPNEKRLVLAAIEHAPAMYTYQACAGLIATAAEFQYQP